MPTLQLLLLGAFELRYDDQPLPKPSTLKSQSLLAYLATHRQQPQSRERLANLFWGDQLERKARSSLSTALWHIRRCFPDEEPILSDPHSVQFDPACDLWLDFEAFESYVTAEDMASLEAGLALYRGEFMEGFYDDWILTYRYRLESLFSEALARRMTGLEAGGEYEGALAAALKLADHDPLREDAHGVAMRAYYRLGQRSAALKQYGRCQAILEEELGIEPGSSTTEMYEAIREGREIPVQAHLASGKGRVSALMPDAVEDRHNLPAQTTPFVGREAELAELARLLADPGVRLLSILGAGGMGKTRLALEAGRAQLGSFEHGVYYVPLAPLESVETIVPTTAEALGFSFYKGVEPRQQLLEYLRRKHMLLVMDNLEHLLACPEPDGRDGAELVSDILRTAPEVKVLVTSRARLNVQGEWLLNLDGMAFPEWETEEEAARRLPEDAADPEGWTEYSAIELFLQNARRTCPDFELEADDLKQISRICRLVDGMPLGILLAAGWLTMLTPAEIADQISGQISGQQSGEIEASLDFLETELRDVPKRQRSMRTLFDHSWKLLTEREQEVFQWLSVFRGGFTRQAAQWVASASLRELRALVDKSLLQREPDGRYGMHELLRQYAADKIRRADRLRRADGLHQAGKARRAEELGEVLPEEKETRDRHCTYYADYLRGKEAHLTGRGQQQALADIGAEIENVRAAWSWAVDQGKVEEMEHSVESIAEFYRIRAWFQEGEEIFAKAVQRLVEGQEEFSDRESEMVLGKLLARQGWFCGCLGLVEKGSELLQRSLGIFHDLGAQRETAYALYHLGYDVLEQAGGRPLYQEGLAIFEEIGDRRGIALTLGGLGWDAVLQQGEYKTAKRLFQESLAIFRELGNQEGMADSLTGLGYTLWTLGDYGEARQLHYEGLGLRLEIGHHKGIADSLDFLAHDSCGLEEYEEARALWQESLANYREIGNLWGMAWALGNMGELANVLGEHAEALQLAQESLALFKEIDARRGISWSLRVLGNAACGLGDLAGAKRYLHQALEAVAMVGVMSFVPLTLVGIATLMSAEGQKERALELLAFALHHPICWQWVRDRTAPLVAELEVELPPEVVAAANARGRARDLDTTVAELLEELGGTRTELVDQSD